MLEHPFLNTGGVCFHPVFPDVSHANLALRTHPAGTAGLKPREIRAYFIGDTRGLSIVEWMAGPMKETILQNERFAAAVNGITMEDGPYVGLPCWMHPDILLDPDGTGNLMTCEEFSMYAFPTFAFFLENLVSDLRDRFIFRTNGVANPWNQSSEGAQLIFQMFHGPKFEQYGNWGGWPNWDNDAWFYLWEDVEDLFVPFGEAGFLPPLDAIVGQDIVTAQCMPKRDLSAEARRRWMRHRLGHALMYNGSMSFSWWDDQFGLRYLAGEITEWPVFPEMHFALGAEVSPRQTHVVAGAPDTPCTIGVS